MLPQSTPVGWYLVTPCNCEPWVAFYFMYIKTDTEERVLVISCKEYSVKNWSELNKFISDLKEAGEEVFGIDYSDPVFDE